MKKRQNSTGLRQTGKWLWPLGVIGCVVGWGSWPIWPCWPEEAPSVPPAKEKPAISLSESVGPGEEPLSKNLLGADVAKDSGAAEGTHRTVQPVSPELTPVAKQIPKLKPEPPRRPLPKNQASPPEGPWSKVSSLESSRGAIQGPRDLLALFGMDESHFRRLTDGAPLASGEEELLLKLLFRSVEFPLEDLERWASRQVNIEELAAAPRKKWGEVYWLSGRVQKMEVCHPPPEAAQRYLMDQYYCCELLLEEGQQPVLVYVRIVPRAWLEKPPTLERAGFLGFFLKTTSSDPQKPTPMFAAHRIAWYPAGLLGDLGMDVGLLDGVVDRQTILPEERETFYQLLAAMRRANPGQILQAAQKQAKSQGIEVDRVVPLFKEPSLQRGRLVLLRGAAREVTRVEVQDPDIRARFGIDHYYKISLFTPDSQGNPLFVCVPSLPEGMPTGEGIQYVEEVKVAAFFLKSWSYRTTPPPDAPPEKRSDMIVWKRQAPLLIGDRPVWYPPEEPNPHTLAAAAAGILFALAGIGLWWAVWRAHRSDQQFRRRFSTRAAGEPVQLGPALLETTEGTSLSDEANPTLPPRQEQIDKGILKEGPAETAPQLPSPPDSSPPGFSEPKDGGERISQPPPSDDPP